MIRNISCARAWEVFTQDVIRQYKAECAEPSKRSTMCLYDYPAEWVRWATIEPPLQIKP